MFSCSKRGRSLVAVVNGLLVFSAVAQNPPGFTTAPSSQSATIGASVQLSATVSGTAPITYQWQHNGVAIATAAQSSLLLANVQPADAGIYTLVATNAGGTSTSTPAVVGLTSATRVAGAASIVGTDIVHPNGNHFDQVLLQGVAAAITNDVANNRITRTSYIDLNDDIVQIEFSGPGTLSVVLDGSSGPAPPVNYNQPTVSYMKGHASIVVSGATQGSNVSVFTVGHSTAFDPTGAYNLLLAPGDANDPAKNGSPLFAGKSTVNYDGIADLAFVAISSTDGTFGGLRMANASCWNTKGITGICAPDVHFTGPVNVEDVNAKESAAPLFVIGGADGGTRITGGDLKQDNGRAVQVSALAQLVFTAGATSHNAPLAAQPNRARLDDNGVNVTTQIAVSSPDPFDLLDSFLAMDSSLAGPSPDVTIAVGRSELVVMRNGALSLWQKATATSSARLLGTQYTSEFYSPVRKPGDKFVDPFVLFDEQSARYFIVNAGYNECPDCGAHLLAISKTSSPKTLTAQDWHFVRLARNLERVGSTVAITNYDGDNDRLAATPDSLLIGSLATHHPGANDDAGNASSVGARIRVLDKKALMNGQTPPTWIDFVPSTLENARVRVAPLYDPSDRIGGPYRVFFDMLSVDPCGNGRPVSLYLGAVNGLDGGTPSVTTREIPIPDVGCRFQCVALQPDGARDLLIPHDNINPVYRAGRLWVFETRSVVPSSAPILDPLEGRCGIHWMELDVSDWPNVRILQNAVFSEPGVSMLAPAAALDSAGNFVMVYTRTGQNDFPSIYYTGRLPTDPPNALRPGRLLRAGTRAFDDRPPGYSPDRNQFIDYPAAVADPVDGSIWIGGLVPSPQGPSSNGLERSDCWIGRIRPLSALP